MRIRARRLQPTGGTWAVTSHGAPGSNEHLSPLGAPKEAGRGRMFEHFAPQSRSLHRPLPTSGEMMLHPAWYLHAPQPYLVEWETVYVCGWCRDEFEDEFEAMTHSCQVLGVAFDGS